MLKLTSLAIGLFTIISMAPTSEAMAANTPAVSISQPAANLHSQVILKIGDRDRGGYIQRQRERELQRERQTRRRERARRRYERSYNEYRRDRPDYRY